jgi:hypothetical protein
MINAVLRGISVIVCGVILVMGFVAGCGDESDDSQTTAAETTPAAPTTPASPTTPAVPSTQEPACDLDAASIIPEPSSNPQHIYFYRDT